VLVRFQAVAEDLTLECDFAAGADPEPPEHRDRRAPPLERVLEQERPDHQRQQGEPAVHQQGQGRPGGRQRGGVRLQRPLDVPLPVELAQPAVDGSMMSYLYKKGTARPRPLLTFPCN